MGKISETGEAMPTILRYFLLLFLANFPFWTTEHLFCILDKLDITFSRSSGPGGQNVNKCKSFRTLMH